MATYVLYQDTKAGNLCVPHNIIVIQAATMKLEMFYLLIFSYSSDYFTFTLSEFFMMYKSHLRLLPLPFINETSSIPTGRLGLHA